MTLLSILKKKTSGTEAKAKIYKRISFQNTKRRAKARRSWLKKYSACFSLLGVDPVIKLQNLMAYTIKICSNLFLQRKTIKTAAFYKSN